MTLKRASRVRPHSTKKESASVSSGVRSPSAKARVAGATPKETWWEGKGGGVSEGLGDGGGCIGRGMGKDEGRRTNQVRETVQLLAHQAALAAPPRHLAVHEVEEQAERHERQRRPRVAERARRPEAVPQRAEDGHEAAEACGEKGSERDAVQVWGHEGGPYRSTR